MTNSVDRASGILLIHSCQIQTIFIPDWYELGFLWDYLCWKTVGPLPGFKFEVVHRLSQVTGALWLHCNCSEDDRE